MIKDKFYGWQLFSLKASLAAYGQTNLSRLLRYKITCYLLLSQNSNGLTHYSCSVSFGMLLALYNVSVSRLSQTGDRPLCATTSVDRIQAHSLKLSCDTRSILNAGSDKM